MAAPNRHHHHHHCLAFSQPPPPPLPPTTAATNPPPPALPLAPVTVSSLSLESYISLFQALTKGAPTVQGVSAIEEAGMRLPDLRALAASNGVAVGGGVGGNRAPARRDVLLSLRGRELADPLACAGRSGAAAWGSAAGGQQPLPLPPPQPRQHEAEEEQEGGGGRHPPVRRLANGNGAPAPLPLLLAAADVGALGWVGPDELGQMERALRSMSVVSLPQLPPVRWDAEQGEGAAAVAATTEGTAAAGAVAPVAAPVAAAGQVQLDDDDGGNKNQNHEDDDDDDDETMLSEGAAAVAATTAAAADAPTSKPPPPAPVPWLPASMARFARAVAGAPFAAVAATPALGGTQAVVGGGIGFFGSSHGSSTAAAAAAAAMATQQQHNNQALAGEPSVALGDVVSVCLLEPMDVTAAAPADNSSNNNNAGRRAVLPPGVYCARLVRRLGPACIPVSVCEPVGCPAVHDFYHCRLLPSPLVVGGGEEDEEEGEEEAAAQTAVAAVAASAALSGRAVTLVLDLHKAHRCAGGLDEMARLDPERLQDAWVALMLSQAAAGGSAAAASQAAAAAAAGGGGKGAKRARVDGAAAAVAW